MVSSANKTFSFPKDEANPTLLNNRACTVANTNNSISSIKSNNQLMNGGDTLISESSIQHGESPSNTPTNTFFDQKTHKRGTGSSAFNSDSTLVDNIPIIRRTCSSSSEVSSNSSLFSTYRTVFDAPKLASLVISEESKDTESNNDNNNNNNNSSSSSDNTTIRDDDQPQNFFDPKIENIYKKLPHTPTIDFNLTKNSGTSQPVDYFAQNLNSSSRGISNRSMNLLGHRTSKSENITLKLPKKLESKPSNQLNLLEEETCSSDSNIIINFDNPLPSAPLMSENGSSSTNTQTNSHSNNSCSTTSSPISSSFNFSLFRKHPIPSNLKNDPTVTNKLSIPARHSLKLKSTNLKLPDEVSLLKIENAEAQILQWSASTGLDGLSNLLIIDLRPFHDYCKSHITGAINVCLPSTLLKRSTFTLQKCIQTLTETEKNLFEDYFKRSQNSLPRILFYDDFNSTENNISPSIFHLANKFIQSNLWDSKLFILEGGFDESNERFRSTNRFTNKDSNSEFSDVQSVANTSALSVNSGIFSPPIFSSSPQSLISPGNCFINRTKKPSGTAQTPLLSTSFPTESNNASASHISLSRFVLPEKHSPVFKTKNYDEVLSNKPDSSIHLATELSPHEIETLPDWLSDVIGTDNGAFELTKKFNDLQIQERERLKHALAKINTKDSVSTAESPIISSGVELGNKNRYKDILIYEHARVKLNEGSDNTSNYINASYIKYPATNLRYIATQGPLNDTIGDFWKMVYDNKVPLILSLTPQKENKVEKCAPFWEPGTFLSDNEKINVELIEEIDDLILSSKQNTKCISRRLVIQIDDKPKREVLQLHMISWPDFGIVICEEDILSLVSLKRYITEKLDVSNQPVLVHCSAGCGRTGSFCVIDTCIDILYNDIKSNKIEKSDLIYDITSVFRSQRVFMVQTLRQYILIYDSIIKFIKMHERSEKFKQEDLLNDGGLVDWEFKDPGIFKRFLETFHDFDEK